MEILKISKADKEVVARFTAEELSLLCNVFHEAKEVYKDNPYYHQLFSEILIANDLTQYGHLDNFCFRQIVKERNFAIMEGEENTNGSDNKPNGND